MKHSIALAGGAARSSMLALLCGLLALCALPATGQIPEQVTSAPAEVSPPPPGSGNIHGRLLSDDSTVSVAGLPIVLYALGADGSSGLAKTQSDDAGGFDFNAISTDPGMVYLVGTQRSGVPFAQRVQFEADQTDLDVELVLRKISENAAALRIIRSAYKLDWIGRQLFVQISHLVENTGQTVIHVEKNRRDSADPLLVATLPDGVARFIGGQETYGVNFHREEERLSAWGPVYPGSQELRYAFLLEGPETNSEGASPSLDFRQPLPAGSAQVDALVPTGDASPLRAGSETPSEVIEIEGESYARYSVGEISPGGEIRFSVAIPETSNDAAALRLMRADYWLDHDDTHARLTVNLSLEVAGNQRLSAPPGESLLEIPLPPNAEFLGLSPGASALGLQRGESGGLSLLGPIPAGKSGFSYRYRIPVEGPVHLDLGFQRPLDLLNFLVADNGVAIEAQRLHRRRPFKEGTRFYLHREAYQLRAGEEVPVILRPLSATGATSLGGRLAACAFALLIIAFLVTPLRQAGDPGGEAESPLSSLAREREAIYESIRDLDHDFETGKLDEEDYRGMRNDLRALAVETIRRERKPAGREISAANGPTPDRTSPTCPNCGVEVESGWRFCSICGTEVAAGKDGA